MARFNFRLQQYLGIKEQIEEQKELEYAKAIRKLEEEKAMLAGMLADRDAQIQAMQEEVQNSIDRVEIKYLNDSIDRIKRHITQQRERVAAAEEYAELKRLELVEAMKERKAMEVVRDNARAAFLEQEKINEAKQIDELVSFKYKEARN